METVDHIICGDFVLTMAAPEVAAGREGDAPGGVIGDGAVAVKDGRIVAVGTRKDISSRYSSRSFFDGAGRAVMPGLVNTHTHAAMALMRGMADDLPLREWLEGHIWPVENRWLGPEFIEDGVSLACLEMLKAGVTSFNDMYFFEDVAACAVKKIGMRAVLGAGVIDFPTRTTTGAEDCLRKAESFIGEWRGDSLITPAIAPHSAYACGPDTLRRTMDLAIRHDAPVHIHLSEAEWEAAEIKGKYGKAPAKYLEGIGFLNKNVLAAHCVWLTEEEIEAIADNGVAVSHCVESNLKLASGIAPVPAMLKAGIKVTFGTDGAASNNDLNILSEMSTAAKLHKAVSKDPTALDAGTVLAMATRWGAEALGLDAGSLEPGKEADIVAFNIDRPHLVPLYNVCSNAVYSLRPSDVETVMVSGRVVVDGGRLVSADEDEILFKAKAWGRRIRGAENPS